MVIIKNRNSLKVQVMKFSNAAFVQNQPSILSKTEKQLMLSRDLITSLVSLMESDSLLMNSICTFQTQVKINIELTFTKTH
jgi:hypothetical protein